MAATLSLDTITSSGSGITIDATKTFTVNGTLLTTGSTNVLHKTGDYPIVTGDIAGKSELIITATTAAPRNITLPGLAVAGAATCVITIMVSADATGTNSLRVQEGTTEVWTGYQKGDFVRLCISDGAWIVVDHKETYYSHRYLTSDQSTAVSATTKATGFTNIKEVGNTWDNANDKLVTPTGMKGYWNVSFNLATVSGASSDPATCPAIYLGGVSVTTYKQGNSITGGYNWGQNAVTGRYYATSAQAVEFYFVNFRSDYASISGGGSAEKTHFTAQFERVY
tara:strand:- start:212 stop:1057 length:846 start_codon:yes stop_codon:yes gene_type:complete